MSNQLQVFLRFKSSISIVLLIEIKQGIIFTEKPIIVGREGLQLSLLNYIMFNHYVILVITFHIILRLIPIIWSVGDGATPVGRLGSLENSAEMIDGSVERNMASGASQNGE